MTGIRTTQGKKLSAAVLSFGLACLGSVILLFLLNGESRTEIHILFAVVMFIADQLVGLGHRVRTGTWSIL